MGFEVNIDMLPLKTSLFKELRKLDKAVKTLTDEEADQLIFKMPSFMGLTYSGFVLLNKYFTAYSFSLDENLKPKFIKNLSKLESPYYYYPSRLVIFSSMDATAINLVGGVENYLSNNLN